MRACAQGAGDVATIARTLDGANPRHAKGGDAVHGDPHAAPRKVRSADALVRISDDCYLP